MPIKIHNHETSMKQCARSKRISVIKLLSWVRVQTRFDAIVLTHTTGHPHTTHRTTSNGILPMIENKTLGMRTRMTIEKGRFATKTEGIAIHTQDGNIEVQMIDIKEIVNPKTKHQRIVGTDHDTIPTVETNPMTEIEEIAIDVNQERAVTRVIEDHILEMNHPIIDETVHRIDHSSETIEIELRIDIVETELLRDIEAETNMNNNIVEVQDKETIQTSETDLETQDKVKVRTIIRRIAQIPEMNPKPSLFLLKKTHKDRARCPLLGP